MKFSMCVMLGWMATILLMTASMPKANPFVIFGIIIIAPPMAAYLMRDYDL